MFKKSSFCNFGNCVEVADWIVSGKVFGKKVRSFVHEDGSYNYLTFTNSEWDDFVKGVKAGEFDV